MNGQRNYQIRGGSPPSSPSGGEIDGGPMGGCALVAILVLALTGCTDSSFRQVGYFKGQNNLRFYTFNVQGYDHLAPGDSLPPLLIRAIREHGSSRMNTAGRVTASFYYTKSSAPDITLMTADQAREVAHERMPIIAIWIMPTGRVNTILNPGAEALE